MLIIKKRGRGKYLIYQIGKVPEYLKKKKIAHTYEYLNWTQTEMKEIIRKEYLRIARKLLETKLCCRNIIKPINTLAVPLVRYSEPFLKLTMEELRQKEQRKRKLKTMHKVLHLKDNIDWFYESRKEKRRRIASIEDCIYVTFQVVKEYTKRAKND